MSLLFSFESSSLGVSNPADFTVTFPLPVKLEPQGTWEIGLLQANVWYSYYNISASYDNNTFRYYNGTAWRDVTIPNGTYQLTDINTYLQSQMVVNGDYTFNSSTQENVYDITINANYNTGNSIVEITSGSGYILDLTTGNLCTILGFSAVEISVTTQSPNQVDITNGINNLFIHCSAVSTSYLNGASTSDVIYSFIPQTPPFSLVAIAPYKVVFTPVLKNQIDSIRIYITDQFNRPIDLNGQPTSYTFILRQNNSTLSNIQNKILSEGFKGMLRQSK